MPVDHSAGCSGNLPNLKYKVYRCYILDDMKSDTLYQQICRQKIAIFVQI